MKVIDFSPIWNFFLACKGSSVNLNSILSAAPKKPAAPAPPVRAVQPVPSPRASPLPKNDQFRETAAKPDAVRDVDAKNHGTAENGKFQLTFESFPK
jgi:hypothetical protein